MKVHTAIRSHIKRLTKNAAHHFIIDGKKPEQGQAVFTVTYRNKKSRLKSFVYRGPVSQFDAAFDALAAHIRDL
jgi:hypothetical protein